MAKLHKVEFYLVDYDSAFEKDWFEEELCWQFADIRGAFHYGRDGEAIVKVMGSKIQTVEIGEWHDDHKFNSFPNPLEKYEEEFEEISSFNKTIRDRNTKNEYSEDYYYQAIRME